MLSREQIAAEIAELSLSFPVVAPRIIENLQHDRDLLEGFDTPVLACLARFQIPVIMQRLEDIGAYVEDPSRRSGYVSTKRAHITNGKAHSPAAKAAYFKSYADVIFTKISEGMHNKMAAMSLSISTEAYHRLNSVIWPVLKKFLEEEANQIQTEPKSVNMLFCSVIDDKQRGEGL